MKNFIKYRNREHPHGKFYFKHKHNKTSSFAFDKIFFQNNKPTTSIHRNPYSVNNSVISKVLFQNLQTSFSLNFTALLFCYYLVWSKISKETDAPRKIVRFNRYLVELIRIATNQFLEKLYASKTIQDTVNKEQIHIV